MPADPSDLSGLRAAVAALPGYVAGRRATAATTAPLASNESHEPPLPGVVEAIGAAGARANRYPDMGTVELRSAIARRLGVSASQIAVGAGSVAVLGQLVSATCDAGDEVVMAWRSFEAYPILTTLAGAVAVRVPLLPDESHDLEAMLAAVTERTRLVLLCTPNNPTGVPLTTDQIRGFLARLGPDVIVGVDEAYLEYSGDPLGGSGLALVAADPRVCLLRTFSKAWGLAGLRVGYAVATEPLAEGLRRTAIPFGVSAVAQAAALAALLQEEEVLRRAAAVAAERERVLQHARQFGWRLPASAANFVWIRLEGPGFEALMEAFDEADILVRGYPGDGIRISLADPISNDRVLAVLESAAALAR